MNKKRKDPAAVKLGRKGGMRSSAVRTAEQQQAMSSKGGRNRWKNQKVFSTNPLAVYQRERRRKMRLELEKDEDAEREPLNWRWRTG